MKRNGKTLELLKQFEAMGIPSIDCIVCHKGQRVFRYMSGYFDDARTKPIDGTECYNIYSCSKAITCTAALQLVENDAIRLDDAVCEYLPEFRKMKKIADGKLKDVKNTMTIRHLFTMTAGLTYATGTENILRGQRETQGRMPTRKAMKYLACDPLAFEPGADWKYSLCHDVLAAVVEVVSGKRFSSYVKENIFDRVGMKHSTFRIPETNLSKICAQYRYDTQSGKYDPCGPRCQKSRLGSEYESGGAGCVSSLDDYITFLEALRTGETLLRRDTIVRMTCPQISKAAEKSFHLIADRNYSYGLGVRCPRPDGIAHDYGWDGAAGAYYAVIPSEEVSFLYVQHVLNSPVLQLARALTGAVLADIE